jgi:hypothetical protein
MAIIALVCISSAFGGEVSHGRVGLSASMQGEQFGISVPVWVSEQIVITPSFSILEAEDVGADLGVGIAQRLNLRTGNVVPYVGGRLLAANALPDQGKAITDWIFGLMVGSECFVNEHFSVAAEAQLNISSSDEQSNRFGNPGGTNMNTATAVLATLYF